jgi:hypothetical protein
MMGQKKNYPRTGKIASSHNNDTAEELARKAFREEGVKKTPYRKLKRRGVTRPLFCSPKTGGIAPPWILVIF